MTTRELLSLSRTERALLVTSAALLLTGRVLLAVSDLDRARGIVGRFAGVLPPFAGVEEPDHITWAVTCADAYLPGTHTCLVRALAAEALLAEHGYGGTVRLGVCKRESEFRAHAWIEREGNVVVGDLTDIDRFRTLSGWDVDP